MLSIALALIVSQNPWQWANDPKYYSGPVIDYCRNGGDCKLRNITANQITLTNASAAIIIPTASFINFYGVSSGSVGIRGSGAGIGVEGTNFYTGTGSHITQGANSYLSFAGYIQAGNFPSAASVRGITAEATTNKLYYTEGLSQWLPFGSAKHPVLQKSTNVYGWKAATPGYEGEPLYDETFTGVSQTEFCAAGTLANVTNMPVGFGTEAGFGRSFTTQAAALATCGDYSSSAFTDASNSRPILTLRLRSDPTAITSTRMLVGFGPSAIFTGPTDNPASEGAWFRYSTSAGDTNLMGCTSNGAAATCTSTGVAYAINTTYLLQVDLSENGAAAFLVNGVVRVRQTTNLPSTTNFGQGVVAYAIAASARNVTTSRRVIEMSR